MSDLVRPEGAEPSTTTPLTRETERGANSAESAEVRGAGQALLLTDVLVEPQTGPRILTLGQQRQLLSERKRLREWVAATVMMVEMNALDAAGIEGIRRTGRELLDV